MAFPTAVLFLLRWVHLMAGIAWVGGNLFMGAVVMRSLMRANDPATMRGFMGHVGDKLAPFFLRVGFVTVGVGFVLYGDMYGYGNLFDTADAHARVYLAALALSVTILVIGFTAQVPLANRLVAFAKGPPGPPSAAVQKDLAAAPRWSMIQLSLMVVVVALMAAGQMGWY